MFPFAVSLSPVDLALWGTLAVLGVFVGRWLFRKDEAIEDRQVERIEVVGMLHGIKLPRLAEILARVVARDWSGFLRECISLRKEAARGKEAVLLMLKDNFFEFQLPARMEVKEERERIMKLVADLNDVAEANEARAEEKLATKLKAEGWKVEPPKDAA